MSAIFGSDYWDIFAGEIHKTQCSDFHVTKPTSQKGQFPGAFYQDVVEEQSRGAACCWLGALLSPSTVYSNEFVLSCGALRWRKTPRHFMGSCL